MLKISFCKNHESPIAVAASSQLVSAIHYHEENGKQVGYEAVTIERDEKENHSSSFLNYLTEKYKNEV